ncbi:MAG TPA: long-chain fatty acid--CoA ligase [Longimicrobiales bacterium]|nr:long-chain fatty acid--CoA ligase [Longimicrobiales bacterium]
MATQTPPSSGRSYINSPGAPEPGTLVDLLFSTCERLGDEEAFRAKVDGEWRSIRYREVEERALAICAGLMALGVARGDRVALLSENRPEWALADFGTQCAGAIVVPIYATLPAVQMRHMLVDSGAELLFVSTAEQRDKVAEIRADLPELRRVVVFDALPAEGQDVLTLAQLEELGRRELSGVGGGGEDPRAEARRRAEPDQVTTMLYTSGTTGTPKGVMLTHNNIHSNVKASGSVLPVRPGDVALSFLPLSHIFERMVDYHLFERGCAIAYAESLEAIPKNLQEVRPTIVASTPRLYEKFHARVMASKGVKGKLVRWASGVGERWATEMLAGRRPGPLLRAQHALADRLVYQKIRDGIGGRLRFFISGGAPLSPDIGRFFYAAGVVILEGYGLTETSPVTNVNRPDALKLGTVGPPLPGTEIRIAEDGEILVRGPQVMKGYYKDEAATAEVIDADGWFYTGDIGELDTDGFLRITDRKKDIIVTAGGKNVAPAPIEQRVKLNPFVEEAVIVGDRRPYTIILVVPDFAVLGAWAAAQGIAEGEPGSLIEESRVQEKMRQEVFGVFDDLASFETPHRMALLPVGFSMESGELTPKQSVKRRVVERKHAGTIEAVYEAPGDVIAALPAED